MKKKKYTLFFLFFMVFLFSVSASAELRPNWKRMANGKYRYYNDEGTRYVRNRWEKIDGKNYYFDSSGYLQLGQFQVRENTFFAAFSTGTMRNMRVGDYFYGSNGVMAKNCWKISNGKYYYFGSDGKIRYGWVTLNGYRYYVTEQLGRACNRRMGDYYFNKYGVMLTNTWVGDYYYGKTGRAQYGVLQQNGKVYYILKASGKVKNDWYNNFYFDGNGVMATDQWLVKDNCVVYVNDRGRISRVNRKQDSLPSESDIRLLAALVYWESGNQPYQGKLAVASVVFNRVNDSSFPNTLYGVIYQSGQFSPAMNGSVGWLLASGQAIQADCLKAAEEVLCGGSTLPGYYFFNNTPIYGWDLQIGDHYFSKVC